MDLGWRVVVLLTKLMKLMMSISWRVGMRCDVMSWALMRLSDDAQPKIVSQRRSLGSYIWYHGKCLGTSAGDQSLTSRLLDDARICV
jgi:hypothetical protein